MTYRLRAQPGRLDGEMANGQTYAELLTPKDLQNYYQKLTLTNGERLRDPYTIEHLRKRFMSIYLYKLY